MPRVSHTKWALDNPLNKLTMPASPLQPGDQLIVTHVSPEAMTPVERLNRQGKRDGCRYELSEYQAVPLQASPEKRRNLWP